MRRYTQYQESVILSIHFFLEFTQHLAHRVPAQRDTPCYHRVTAILELSILLKAMVLGEFLKSCDNLCGETC